MNRTTAKGLSLIIVAFAVSVVLRYTSLTQDGLFGVHQFLLGHSTMIAENWLQAGFFKLHALAFWNPFSVERTTPEALQVYTSFPGGAFAIPYGFSWLFGLKISPLTFKIYALLNQLGISIVIFFLALELTRKIENRAGLRLLLSVLPAFSILFAPGYLWHFGHTWFGEQAGVLPFVGVVLCDVKRRRKLAAAVMAYGTYCDLAFFVSVSIVRFALYAVPKQSIKKRFYLALECLVPVLAVIFVHILLIVSLLGIDQVIHMFTHSLDHIKPTEKKITILMMLDSYARYYFHMAYGKFRYLLPIILGATVYGVFREKRNITRWIYLSFLLTPLLHGLIWRAHTLHHNFNTVRMDPFFALSTFTLLPLLITTFLHSRRLLNAFTGCLILFCAVSFWDWHRVFKGVFISVFEKNKNEQSVERAKRVGSAFGPHDLLLSPDFGWGFASDWTSSVYSKKSVYKVSSVQDIESWRRQVPGASIVLLFEKNEPVLKGFSSCKNVVALADNLHYCRLQ